MNFRLLASIVLLILSNQATAQTMGCTDTLATNYNAAATVNNGSCIYPTTSVNLSQVCLLPSLLNETSGLAIHNGHLFTQLDSGGPNTIFEIDTLTGQILRKIIITNAVNYDWEDIFTTNTHLFIGDFGNNNGNRTDLKVYKLSWAQIGSDTVEYDTAQVINFSYQDQTDFTANFNNNQWDCESMIVQNDSIFLFTKDWVYHRTKLYGFSAAPGTHVAILKDSFMVNGLVTGASLDTIQHKIYLVGYTTGGSSFLWSLYGYNGNNFLKANKRRIELGFAGQTEGITLLGNHRAYISNEKYSFFPARLALMDTKNWSVETGLRLVKKKIGPNYSIFPNPAGDKVYITCNEEKTPLQIKIVNTMGVTIFNGTGNCLDVSAYVPGIYFVFINHVYQTKVLVVH